MSTKVVVIAIVLLALGSAGGGVFMYWRHVAGASAPTQEPPALVQVGAMTVRLADRGLQNEHYLKAAPVLEVCCSGGDKITQDMVYVRDQFVQDASLYTSQDLMNPDGVKKLKSTLTDHLNRRFHGAVKGVLFSELVIE